MLKEPELSVVTEHPEITTKCEDGSKVIRELFLLFIKAIFALFCLMKENILSSENKELIERIVERIICE